MRLAPHVLSPLIDLLLHQASRRTTHTAKGWAVVSVLGLAALLSACGGGGGGSGGATDSGTPSTSLGLSGTVATGAPVTNAVIGIRCNSATGSVVSATATANASGYYSTTLSSASVPCLLQVEVKDSTGAVTDRLYSLAGAVGVANLTPLTTAVVSASLGAEDLSTTFTSFNAGTISTLQSAIAQGKPKAAWAALKTQLTATGVDASAIAADPVTDSFSADATHKGTGHDKVLDDINAKGMTGEDLRRAASGLPVQPLTATGILNDTGIDWCSENITTPSDWISNALCSAINWAGNLWGQQQDAYFGRDAEARAGTLKKVGAGMAGFDFTKLDSGGRALTIQNGTWSDSGTEAAGTQWDCVRDNVTGLVWEVKRNDPTHLRHKDHKYAWYNPDSGTNGDTEGYKTPLNSFSDEDSGSFIRYTAPTCSGVDDVNQCNTKSYVTAVNAVGLCGRKDWRLPFAEELRNLAHSGRSNPSIDTAYFPETASSFYWSSSSYALEGERALLIHFGGSYDDSSYKFTAGRIRLAGSGP